MTLFIQMSKKLPQPILNEADLNQNYFGKNYWHISTIIKKLENESYLNVNVPVIQMSKWHIKSCAKVTDDTA